MDEVEAYHLSPSLFIDTAFKQQRLKAWQPILTPRTVLPTLFIVGILFAPIGALLIWGSSLVRHRTPLPPKVLCVTHALFAASRQITEIDIDYTDCELLTSQNATNTSKSITFTDIPSSKYTYKLRSSDSGAPITTPQYAFLNQTGGVSDNSALQCVVQFDVPADIDAPVLLYYKLTNFYQNHRRYVKSLDQNQLRGDHVNYGTIKGSDCKPLDVVGDKIIYPCGLIANSVFNGAWLSS